MDKCGKEFSAPLATFIDHDLVATAVSVTNVLPTFLNFIILGSEEEGG